MEEKKLSIEILKTANKKFNEFLIKNPERYLEEHRATYLLAFVDGYIHAESDITSIIKGLSKIK